MSRQAQQNVIGTASSENKTSFGNAQSAYGDTQGDIGDYTKALNSFVSSNPYTKGGEYDSTINTGLSNVSDAGSNSLKGALQSQALRTGQNSAADAATAASGAQQNTRDLSSSLATAQQQRIAGETGYKQTGLAAGQVPISAESGLYGTAGGQGNTQLSTQASAAATPGFWDELGNSIASIPGNLATGVGEGIGKGCWIAAAVFNGWEDPRVHLVRAWIFGPFSESRIGWIVSCAYLRFGERTARLIHRFPVLKKAFLPLFNAALRQAGGKG